MCFKELVNSDVLHITLTKLVLNMGQVKSRLARCCPPQCGCCGGRATASYDLKELPRPPRLDMSNGKSRSNSLATKLWSKQRGVIVRWVKANWPRITLSLECVSFFPQCCLRKVLAFLFVGT